MSKQSYIKSYFKVKSIDELEIEELKLAQASRASRATTMETAASIMSISTSLRSIIDLSDNTIVNSPFQTYNSDDDSDRTL